MGSINIALIAAEMQRYVVQNKNVVKADFARALNVPIDKYCRKVTKIQGAYQVLHSLMTHVVQGFEATWQPLGEFHVKDKELKNYHQKINFPFKPADVLGTFLAEWYEEDKKPTDKEIAKRIIDWLMTQITDDVALLSMIGEYDSQNAAGKFGFSINGFNKLVADLLANTTHPCFHIPLATITESNVVDQFRDFERKLPKILKKKIKQIHCSENVKELYGIAYFNEYGVNPSYTDTDKLKSPLGKREIIGHDDMADNVMFATVDGNILNLLDINNPATITDIQTQDYDVKVFGEFWKGWDFLINEAVCVADFSEDAVRGLGNDNLMALYFPHEVIEEEEIAPESITVSPATASIEQGQSQQFTAAVLPEGASQGVTWSVETATGLTISSSGLAETTGETPAGDYDVTATSVADGEVVGSAVLTVTEAG